MGRLIRTGLETLDLPREGESGIGVSGNGNGTVSVFRGWAKWREGEERAFLKRVARAAVEDGRRVVGGR